MNNNPAIAGLFILIMMKRVILFFVFLPLLSFAQQMNTDIYLLNIKLENGKFSFSDLQNITQHAGYDNQPWFAPDGNTILYTAMTKDSATDIFSYTIDSKKTTQLTHTKNTSEYSPRCYPDSKEISVVMVEKDQITQRLWKFNASGKKTVLVADWLDSVGYYAFYNDSVLFAFILGPDNNHTLRKINLNTKSETIIADHVGRGFEVSSMMKVLSSADSSMYLLRYVKKTENVNYLYTYDGFRKSHEKLIETINNSEDFVIYNNDFLLMASGNSLFRLWINNRNVHWEKILEFDFPLQQITRLALSPDRTKMAIVANGL